MAKLRTTHLDEAIAARLLLIAALIDLTFVALITNVLATAFETPFSGLGAVTYIISFVLVLYIYWGLTELILRTRSLGRIVLQLKAADMTGAPLNMGTLWGRFWRKASCGGLNGCHPFQSTPYDRKLDIHWHSPLAPKSLRRAQDWEITVLNGRSIPGQKAKIKHFLKTHSGYEVRVGRGGSWPNLKLKDDIDVSSKHCTLTLVGGTLKLRDEGSTNGTFMHDERLLAGEERRLGDGETFRVGKSVVIRLEK